ncbi:hypothetical protein NL676_018831 [Syzygium grande]|nr:hypothetical protein NL676_018831 [Syzygium grande]
MVKRECPPEDDRLTLVGRHRPARSTHAYNIRQNPNDFRSLSVHKAQLISERKIKRRLQGECRLFILKKGIGSNC